MVGLGTLAQRLKAVVTAVGFAAVSGELGGLGALGLGVVSKTSSLSLLCSPLVPIGH